MSAIRSTDNRTETALRKRLHAMGMRYRKYLSGLPGRPDIVFPGAKVAVFVDGDYWHGRLIVERGWEQYEAQLKTANREYWIGKMRRNIERDLHVTSALEEQGWLVLRMWESDVKRDIGTAAATIATAVKSRRANLLRTPDEHAS